jgi:hypothetical protein
MTQCPIGFTHTDKAKVSSLATGDVTGQGVWAGHKTTVWSNDRLNGTRSHFGVGEDWPLGSNSGIIHNYQPLQIRSGWSSKAQNSMTQHGYRAK